MDREEMIKMYKEQIEHKLHMQELYLEDGYEENMTILDKYQEEIDELEKKIEDLESM